MRKFKKKSSYIAVLLLAQSCAVLAEDIAPSVSADSQAVEELQEIKVKAAAEKQNVGYQATKTRVGKTAQDPHDVPQAVTTLTKELLHDQQISSLRDALRNVAGLAINAAEGGRAGDNFMLRGFYTFGDLYLDNMRDTAQYNRETFNLEQVDVLRGSAAMLFGRGQAGGVINQVSKMAELHDENVITGSVGNYDYHQFTGDFNKQLTDTAAIRVNVMDRHDETFRKNPTTGDNPEFDRSGIAVSFGAGIGTENEFFLNHIYTQTRDVPDFGVRFFDKRPLNDGGNGVSEKTYWGSNDNFDDSDTRMTTGIFTHQFTEETQLRTQLRHADYKRGYWAKTPPGGAAGANPALPAEDNSIGGNVTRKMQYETVELQTDFSTKFDLAGMKHEFVSGLEYLKEDSFRHALLDLDSTAGAMYNRHIINTAGTPTAFEADNYAAYVQDTVEFIPDWKATLGVRRDEMRADYSSTTSPKLSFGENSYRAGLSWQPSEDRHYYAAWSDSFSPTADLYQLTVAQQPPESSKTFEIGSKWLFLDGDLAFRTALFTSTKYWERNNDLESTAAILTRKRRTNGIEVELTGKITDKWDVFFGMALLDARIIKVAQNICAGPGRGCTAVGQVNNADARFEGQRARNTPIGTFNFWTTYAVTPAWKVGGGVEAKGERYAYVPSSTDGSTSFVNGHFNPNSAPGYARVDAMVAYEQPKWAVRLNVKNLLNKEYYDAVYDNGGLVLPGNRRQAIVTTEYKF